jgi:hypothetical protein
MAISEHPVFPGKKGIFFTFAAIALAMIIIFSFNAYKGNELREKTDVVAVRIETMNNFIKDVEQDLEKGLYISSFRALASMTQFVSNNNSFISDVDAGFEELILEGTLENQQLSLMQGSSFADWTDKIEVQADKIGILVNFTIIDVKVNQTDPWFVSVRSDVGIKVRDSKNTSSWNRNRSIETRVGIENFEDPLYVINSQGRVSNAIVKTPYSVFVDNGDAGNLLLHLNNSYYLPSNLSPNFLMRLQGILANSTTGIESLVNLGEFQEQGLTIKDRSAVDYIYFGNQITTNFRTNVTPSWFKLDQDHLEIYEVEDLTV